MWEVLDVYLFCTDGLCGMLQAIEAVFPQSRLQRCIVHQIRSSTKYVSYKDIKTVVGDLKKIYTSVTLEEAEGNLAAFAEKWRKQYPSCVKSWEENWEILSTFFEYPLEIRRIIYTTNVTIQSTPSFRGSAHTGVGIRSPVKSQISCGFRGIRIATPVTLVTGSQ